MHLVSIVFFLTEILNFAITYQFSYYTVTGISQLLH